MAQPLVNGRAWDFIQLLPLYLSTPLVSCTVLTWVVNQEKTNNMGTGNSAISRGHGTKDGSGTMEISMHDAEAMRAVAPNRDLLDLPSTDMQVVMAAGTNTATHVLRNLEFTTDPGGGSQGDMDMKVTLDFVISHVDHKTI